MAKRAWGDDEETVTQRAIVCAVVLLVLFVGVSLLADFRAWEIVRLYTTAVR